MSFVDDFVAQIISLEVSLYHSRARLLSTNDSKALHDLRIAVRKIRSLLRPLRNMPEVVKLNETAAQVGRATTPARDLDVIIHELEKMGYPHQASSRATRVKGNYQRIAGSSALEDLFRELDRWPDLFRAAERADDLDDMKKTVQKALKKRINQLIAGLRDKEFDRHELRIIVKNTRYLTDAFPTLSPLGGKSKTQLKSVQGSLGSWHDHHQWCLRAESESDLREIAPVWVSAAEEALANAEQHLASLLTHLENDLKESKR